MKTSVMTKKLFVMAICFAAMSLSLFAQNNSGNRGNGERFRENFEKMKAEREAYITKAMNLTEDEAKSFLPLCNELQAKKFELNRSLQEARRNIRQAERDGGKASDADYKKVVELSASIKIKEAELDAEYAEKFLKILSAEKVYLYQRAELQYANDMFARRGGENNNNGQRPARPQRQQ